MIIKVTMDNKNRAASDARSIPIKCGGNLAAPSALIFNFKRMGQFFIPKDCISVDRLIWRLLSMLGPMM